MGGAQNHKNPHVAGVGGRSSRSGVQESSSSGHVGPPPRILYDLVAVVQHTGGLEHGHYTCFARDDGSGEYRGERGSGSSACESPSMRSSLLFFCLLLVHCRDGRLKALYIYRAKICGILCLCVYY